MGDTVKKWFADHIGGYLADQAQAAIDGLTAVMPELAVLLLVGCVTIGMFTSTGKWLMRGAMAYVGGALWLVLM